VRGWEAASAISAKEIWEWRRAPVSSRVLLTGPVGRVVDTGGMGGGGERKPVEAADVAAGGGMGEEGGAAEGGGGGINGEDGIGGGAGDESREEGIGGGGFRSDVKPSTKSRGPRTESSTSLVIPDAAAAAASHIFRI